MDVLQKDAFGLCSEYMLPEEVFEIACFYDLVYLLNVIGRIDDGFFWTNQKKSDRERGFGIAIERGSINVIQALWSAKILTPIALYTESPKESSYPRSREVIAFFGSSLENQEDDPENTDRYNVMSTWLVASISKGDIESFRTLWSFGYVDALFLPCKANYDFDCTQNELLEELWNLMSAERATPGFENVMNNIVEVALVKKENVDFWLSKWTPTKKFKPFKRAIFAQRLDMAAFYLDRNLVKDEYNPRSTECKDDNRWNGLIFFAINQNHLETLRFLLERSTPKSMASLVQEMNKNAKKEKQKKRRYLESISYEVFRFLVEKNVIDLTKWSTNSWFSAAAAKDAPIAFLDYLLELKLSLPLNKKIVLEKACRQKRNDFLFSLFFRSLVTLKDMESCCTSCKESIENRQNFSNKRPRWV